MIEQVILNGTNLYTEYGLILASKQIDAPVRKRITIDVPGRDGEIDITERVFSSIPIYKNRGITLRFICPQNLDTDKGAEKIGALFAAFHEKNTDIVFTDDEDYKYVGACSVTANYANKKLDVTMVFNCKPYKYLISDTTQKKL